MPANFLISMGAKIQGCGVIIVLEPHESRRKLALELGATHVIDYRTQDYVAEVKRITQDEGVDFVLDALGGADWKRGYSLLREGGILLCFGFANAAAPGKAHWFRAAGNFLASPRFSPLTLMSDNRGVAGVNLGHMWHLLPTIQRGLLQCVARYEDGTIKPHIDGTYSFEQSTEAFGRLEHGKNLGKVVFLTRAQ